LISEAVEGAKEQRRKAEASPQRADFEREFGKHRVKTEADGSWSLSVREPHEVRKAYEMQEGVRKIDLQEGAKAQSRMRREKVIRKGDGKMVEFPEELIEQAKDKFVPVGRNGNAPSLKFGLSDAFGKYEQGPDGLWFVDNGGWEPTELWRAASVVSPQRDPDGNEWVERNGEWWLGDEVV
jgi:hypothetical protein